MRSSLFHRRGVTAALVPKVEAGAFEVLARGSEREPEADRAALEPTRLCLGATGSVRGWRHQVSVKAAPSASKARGGSASSQYEKGIGLSITGGTVLSDHLVHRATSAEAGIRE